MLALAGASLALPVIPGRVAAQVAAVRISTTLSEAFAEPFYANDLGFYKKAGLAAEITQYSGGETSETAVITGNADIGITTPIQLANAVAHDVPLRLIGYCGQYSTAAPQPALFVALNSAIHTPKDLEGKTVGVNAIGTMNFLGVQAWLTQNNVDVTKVRAVEVPFAQIAAALTRGTIDAGVIGEPFITGAKGTVRQLATPFEVMGPHWSISVWFSSLLYIRANRALIKRYMDVAYQTAKYVNARPAETNAIITKYSKLPMETVIAMRRTQFAEAPDPSTCRLPLDYAYKFKILGHPVTVDDLMSTA
jgi:NitT/TauT family transport system substrate-binding protein